ncbi:hypothetical protein Tco_0114411 [Tanacetum coccineum]
MGLLKLGSDEIEPTNDETSDLEETNHDNKQEIGEIFRIETNLFDYETPLCEKFKEFNYLLKTRMSLLMILWDLRLMKNTRMFRFMNGTKTCHGYTKNHGLTLEYGLNPLQLYIFVSHLIIKVGIRRGLPVAGKKKDIDSKLKEEALRNKAIMEGMIDDNDESSNNGWKRWDGYEISDHDQEKKEYENEHEDEESCELFNNHEL